MDFLVFLLETAFWFVIFRFLFNLFVGNKKKQQEEMATALNEEISKITHIVNVEQHGEQYYWYDRDTGDFLAQGKNIDDIVAVLKVRFPAHFFYLNNDVLLHGPEWIMKPINQAV
jgi:hypothetical protein